MQYLIEGGYLALWGIAMLLVWQSALRLINQAHVALAERGRVSPPRHVMAPMHQWGDSIVAFVALCCGITALIAYFSLAMHSIPVPQWLVPLTLPPLTELIRIVGAQFVLVFFLTRVSESPLWKVVWAFAWCLFSLGLAVMT